MKTSIESEPITLSGDWDQELWLLDPGPFIDIAFAQGISSFVFRAKMHEATTRRQDWTKFLQMAARGRPWRAIWVPYPGNFAVGFDSEHGFNRHVAVWPIWRASRPLSELEQLIENPWNEDFKSARGHYGVDSRHSAKPVKPFKNQERRIILAGMPKSEMEWSPLSAELLKLAESGANGHILHFHGQKSVARSIGIRVPSFDHPVRIDWVDGSPRVLLPNGGIQQIDRIAENKDLELWIRIVGYNSRMLQIDDREELSRTVYDLNLRSLKWAHLNFDRAWDFRRKGMATDIDSPDAEWEPPPQPVKFTKRRASESQLDRWLCDTCSHSFICPYSREGSVCIVPGSDAEELANQFKTRNSSAILEALGTLLAAQTRRMNRAMEIEEETGKLQPEVTKIMNSLFDRGVQMAKLVDPVIAGRSAPKLNIGIFNGSSPQQQATPQMLMAGVMAELESRGISPEEATEEQVAEILEGAVPTGYVDTDLVEEPRKDANEEEA
jgi:hypothetical protein